MVFAHNYHYADRAHNLMIFLHFPLCSATYPCGCPIPSERVAHPSPSLKAQIRYTRRAYLTGHHTHAGEALWTQFHSDSARGRPQSARLIRFSSLKAVSATCERREQTKKRNRKRAEVVALCWRTGVGYILAQYALSHRQLCKNSSFELHAPARRSAAQRRGRCCWRHLSARSGCDRRPYPEGT